MMQEVPDPITPPVIVISQQVAVVVFVIVAILSILLFAYLFYRLNFQAKVGKVDGKHIHTCVMSQILKKTPKMGDRK